MQMVGLCWKIQRGRGIFSSAEEREDGFIMGCGGFWDGRMNEMEWIAANGREFFFLVPGLATKWDVKEKLNIWIWSLGITEAGTKKDKGDFSFGDNNLCGQVRET